MQIKLDQYPQLRFCRIKKGTKKPFEMDWTNKPYTWQEITKFFPEENYGVLCGHGNLAVIDSDKKDLQEWIEKNLPETFKVKTGGGGTHNYYFIPQLRNKIILDTKLMGDVSIHWGEVQSYGTQVVGVGCLHPNGGYYVPMNECEIKTISTEELYSALKPFMNEIKEVEQSKEIERKNYGNKIDELSVVNIWGIEGLKKHKEEYYGNHPIHGSEGGMNFWINRSKNVWSCFRHNSGGGALSAIAVKEGIISCSEARAGLLRGDKAIKAIEKAKEKYGLIEDYNFKIQTKPLMNYETVPNFTLIWDKELLTYKDTEREWLIDKLIPACSVGVWTGKRATYKTFTALEAVYAIGSGTLFMNRYPTKRGKVLYLDKENGIPIVKQRVEMIKKGKGLAKDCDVGFICFSTLKLDKVRDIQEIEKLIIEHKPIALFIDTYRRAISFDENDAGEVSKLFVDTLRPIVEKHKLSIILIHHDKKSIQEHSGDEMDMMRGSSDLANYCDFILKNKRIKESNTIVLEQIKNRNAPEIIPIKIKIETDEETYFNFKCEGEYQPQTREEKFAQEIILWVTKNSISSFTTKDVENLALEIGIKRRNAFYGIKLLEERRLIQKDCRGKYSLLKQEVLHV